MQQHILEQAEAAHQYTLHKYAKSPNKYENQLGQPKYSGPSNDIKILFYPLQDEDYKYALY